MQTLMDGKPIREISLANPQAGDRTGADRGGIIRVPRSALHLFEFGWVRHFPVPEMGVESRTKVD